MTEKEGLAAPLRMTEKVARFRAGVKPAPTFFGAEDAATTRHSPFARREAPLARGPVPPTFVLFTDH